MATFRFKPTPHKEAIAAIAGKPALTRDQFDKLLPELKAYAFTISGVQSFDVLQDIRDRIATLPAGGDWDQIKGGISEQLIPYFVDGAEPPEVQEKQRAAAERRAELLIRTHGSQAYAATAYRLADAQRDLFPYWQYQTLGDANVRESHAALDGLVLPANHPFWATHTPPWDWGCRCQFIPLTADDVEEMKTQDAEKPPEQQRVLDEEQLRLLEEQHTVWRPRNLAEGKGDPVPYSVASPAERGQENPFTWQPSNLGLTLGEIQKRYDPEVFKTFTTWAQGAKIPGTKQTVWGWMEKKFTPPAPKAPREPKPAPVAETPKPAETGAWPELSSLKKERALGGSTGAELWQAPDGRRFVLKRGASPDHLREEHAADQLYRALGVPVPNATIIETPNGPVKVAEFIEGQQLTAATAGKYRDQIAPHFAADVLLGNWDVAGAAFDNLIAGKEGQVWRIDNGGALRFRAQGAAKGGEWNEFPKELWTLRDPKANAQTAALFGQLTIYDVAKQIEKMDPAALAAAPAELRATLEARLGHLRDLGRKAGDMQKDAWKPEYADGLTRQMLGLREAGIVAELPKLLNRNPGEVIVKDENGNPFDHLRTVGKHATKQTANTVFHDSIVGAAKTINHHHGQGDTDYGAGKIEAALAQKPALEKMLAGGTAAEKKVAQHYLDALATVEAAKGDKAKTVAHVALLDLPKDKKPLPESLVSKLEKYIKDQGGDWKHVENWASAQAGSSSSKEAAAYKYFLAQGIEGAKTKDFHGGFSKAAFDKVVPASAEESYRISMSAHHAFIQEMLGKTAFEGNDRDRRLVRILRTETDAKAVPFAPGEKGTYQRGVNESGSIYQPFSSGARTITAVPHSRITAAYFLERSPGKGGTFLYGDSENELTYMGHGLETLRVAPGYVNPAPGQDASKWEISKP